MSMTRLVLAASSARLFTRKNISCLPMLKPVALSSVHMPKRFFASDNDVKNMFFKTRVNRISHYESKANELITAIRAGNYAKATDLC